MQDYNINAIENHLVVCYMPSCLPWSRHPFVTPEGKPGRLYSFFDSYVEYVKYTALFSAEERSFFELVFGELPQKPHFDVDIDVHKYMEKYGDSVDTMVPTLIDALIRSCIMVLGGLGITLNVNKDILLYSSHGTDKRSVHMVINNYYHDGNDDALAFYWLVVEQISKLTDGKYVEFIDNAVYSKRQQFRILGCRKIGTERVKVYHESFLYDNIIYEHAYTGEITDSAMKVLTMTAESLVSFTAGCQILPSLYVPKSSTYIGGDSGDLSDATTSRAMEMIKEVMEEAPFKLEEVKGSLLVLKRMAPSYCPLCETVHEAQHPFMYITNSKLYWNCRRWLKPGPVPRFFVGYIDVVYANEPNSTEGLTGDRESSVGDANNAGDGGDEGYFSFGDYIVPNTAATSAATSTSTATSTATSAYTSTATSTAASVTIASTISAPSHRKVILPTPSCDIAPHTYYPEDLSSRFNAMKQPSKPTVSLSDIMKMPVDKKQGPKYKKSNPRTKLLQGVISDVI